MSAQTGVQYEFQSKGAEKALNDFRSLREEFKQGRVDMDTYAQAKGEARYQSKLFADTFWLEQQLWLEAHPKMMALTNALTIYSSVAATAMAVQNSLNIAMLAYGNSSSQVISANQTLAEAERNLAIMRADPRSSPLAIAAAEDAVRTARSRVTDATNTEKNAESNRIISAVAGFGQLVAVGITSAIGLASKWGTVSGAVSDLIGWIGRGGLAFGGLAVAGAAAIGAIAGALVGFFTADWLNENTVWYHKYAIGLTTFVNKTLPDAINAAGTFLYGFFTGNAAVWGQIEQSMSGAWKFIHDGFIGFLNGLIGLLNGAASAIATGMTDIANLFIDGINGIIGVANQALDFLHLPEVGTVGHITLTAPTIPTIAAATGFSGYATGATHFLAGEAGMEPVAVGQNAIDAIAAGRSPLTSAGNDGSGGAKVFNVTINGPAYALHDLYEELDRIRENAFRDRGWKF